MYWWIIRKITFIIIFRFTLLSIVISKEISPLNFCCIKDWKIRSSRLTKLLCKQIAPNFLFSSKKFFFSFQKIICAQESSLNGHKFHSWKTNFNRQSITIYFDNNKAITHMHIYFYFKKIFLLHLYRQKMHHHILHLK